MTTAELAASTPHATLTQTLTDLGLDPALFKIHPKFEAGRVAYWFVALHNVEAHEWASYHAQHIRAASLLHGHPFNVTVHTTRDGRLDRVTIDNKPADRST